MNIAPTAKAPEPEPVVEEDPVPEPTPPPAACTPFQWVKSGPLFASSAAENDGFLSPAIAEHEGVVHLWFAEKTGLNYRLLHSTSADGETFGAPEPVTGLKDGNIVAYPSVLVANGVFQLWYGSGSFDYAESTDGAHFTVKLDRTLTAGAQGSFDMYGVLYPAAVVTDAGRFLYYTGFSGQAYAIGRATIGDDGALSRDPTTPVLNVGRASDFDNKAVAQSSVVFFGGEQIHFYGAYDTRKTNPGPYRIAWATSKDGLAWDKKGIALDLGPEQEDAYSTRDPAVLRRDHGWLMVYAGYGKDRRYRLLAATAPDCP